MPQRLLDAGFTFEHPTFEPALRAVLRGLFWINRHRGASGCGAAAETGVARQRHAGRRANGKKDLMSNEAFAEILRGLGVEPPRKISPITNKWTYAFAKTDKDFIKLEEHPDPAVQMHGCRPHRP